MKRLLSVILCSVILFSLAVPAFATPEQASEQTIIYDDGETKIVGYEDAQGNTILEEYIGGRLTQRDTIFKNDPYNIREEYFSYGLTPSVEQNTISVLDYGIITQSPVLARSNLIPCHAGKIFYRTPDDYSLTGYYEYGVNCVCYKAPEVQTTYTVTNFTGKLITLVGLLVGGLNAPAVIIDSFIKRVLWSAGISLISGELSKPFSDTLSCKATEYTWEITDRKYPDHTKTVYGEKYFINDELSYRNGETHYEGYVPADWGKQSFAALLHYEMYSYSIFEVVGWG